MKYSFSLTVWNPRAISSLKLALLIVDEEQHKVPLFPQNTTSPYDSIAN